MDKSIINKKNIIIFIFFLLYLLLNRYTSFYIPCIFHKLTNLYCPGCGITRMFLRILKLDFYGAFRYNPFAFIIVPILIIISFMKNKKVRNVVYYSLIILSIIFMILRNLDGFNFLAPTKV